MNERMSNRLRTDRLNGAELARLWWAVPPLVVLVLANAMFELAGMGYAEIGTQLVSEDGGRPLEMGRDAVVAGAALGWAATLMAYLCVIVATLLAAWRIINTRVQGVARRPFLLFAAAATLLGIANLLIVDTFDLSLAAVFEVTYRAILQEPAITAERARVAGAVVMVINVLTAFVPALLLAAVAASALPPKAGWSEVTVARRARQLRRLVAIAAAYLVVGVLHMGAWTQLAGATLGAQASAALDAAAVAVTLFWGTAFALMIASFYVPLALSLSELAEHIMDDIGVPPDARPKWLVDRGLSFDLSQQLPQIAAVAAPLFAGSLSAALGAGTQLLVP